MGELSIRRVVGLGAGGHAKVLIDLIEQLDAFELVGLLESDATRWGQTLMGYPIIGGDEQLPQLSMEGITHAFIGLGSTGNNQPRGRVFAAIQAAGITVATLVHPRAIVAQSVEIAPGGCVMAGAIIQADTVLAENVVINTRASIDHDCNLAAHVFVAPGATISGGVTVGSYTHIGTGAVIRQGVIIGHNTIIGMGAVVIKNVPDNVVIVGNPGRILRENH